MISGYDGMGYGGDSWGVWWSKTKSYMNGEYYGGNLAMWRNDEKVAFTGADYTSGITVSCLLGEDVIQP